MTDTSTYSAATVAGTVPPRVHTGTHTTQDTAPAPVGTDPTVVKVGTTPTTATVSTDSQTQRSCTYPASSPAGKGTERDPPQQLLPHTEYTDNYDYTTTSVRLCQLLRHSAQAGCLLQHDCHTMLTTDYCSALWTCSSCRTTTAWR